VLGQGDRYCFENELLCREGRKVDDDDDDKVECKQKVIAVIRAAL